MLGSSNVDSNLQDEGRKSINIWAVKYFVFALIDIGNREKETHIRMCNCKTNFQSHSIQDQVTLEL